MGSDSLSRTKANRHSLCTCTRRPLLPLPRSAPPSVLPRATSPTGVKLHYSAGTTSPTRVRLYSSTGAVSVHRSSPASISIQSTPSPPPKRKTCSCSPTTHPGSFRCAFHRSSDSKRGGGGNRSGRGAETASFNTAGRLSLMRSAMANSVVRIGGVEGGEWVNRALSTLIWPSSHQQRRRAAFLPGPSRLSVMSRADD